MTRTRKLLVSPQDNINHISIGAIMRRFKGNIVAFSTLRTDSVTTIATVGVDGVDKYVPIFFQIPGVRRHRDEDCERLTAQNWLCCRW